MFPISDFVFSGQIQTYFRATWLISSTTFFLRILIRLLNCLHYCFIFFLMNFTVLILIDSSCALTNYLLFYSCPSWWKFWQCFSSWEYGMTLTLIPSLCFDQLWILCKFYVMLSLFQAPGSKTVVQSFGKKWCEKSVGLGEGADRRRPLSQVARVLFSLASLACEQALLLGEWNESRENARASATCLGAWHRLYHTSLSRWRFEDVIFSPWSLLERKEIHLS